MRERRYNTTPPRKRRQPVESQGRGLSADNRSPVSDICGDPRREATLLFRQKRAALQQREPAERLNIDLV